MAEDSRFWNGVAVGDAVESPYDADTEFAQVLMSLTPADRIANKGGVWNSYGLGGLAVTNPSANIARVASGRGMVFGTWYATSANVDVSVPTPISATRIDRIVLRKSWSAQTVRVTRIPGAEGGSEPALQQSSGTTWDIPLAKVSITTGGVVTLTDERDIIDVLSPNQPGSFITHTRPQLDVGYDAANHSTVDVDSAGNTTIQVYTSAVSGQRGKLHLKSAAGTEAGVILQDRVNSFVEIRPQGDASSAGAYDANPLNSAAVAHHPTISGHEVQFECNYQAKSTNGTVNATTYSATHNVANTVVADLFASPSTVYARAYPIQVIVTYTTATGTALHEVGLVSRSTGGGTSSEPTIVDGFVLLQYPGTIAFRPEAISGSGNEYTNLLVRGEANAIMSGIVAGDGTRDTILRAGPGGSTGVSDKIRLKTAGGVTVYGLTAYGDPLAPVADTSSSSTTFIVKAGSNGGSNDTQCRIDFARSSTTIATFGFDSDTTSVVAGRTKTAADMALATNANKHMLMDTSGNTWWAGTVTAATFAGALTGNASTASALTPGATINGVTFTGGGNITVTAAAGTLTGTTLNATVVTSSLTTVGTLTSITTSGMLDVAGGNTTGTGGARIKGVPTAAGADTGNINTTLIIAAGSNTGANDTQCRLDFARSNSLYLTFGFDNDTSSVVAGHTKATSDLGFGFLGTKRILIDTNGNSWWAGTGTFASTIAALGTGVQGVGPNASQAGSTATRWYVSSQNSADASISLRQGATEKAAFVVGSDGNTYLDYQGTLNGRESTGYAIRWSISTAGAATFTGVTTNGMLDVAGGNTIGTGGARIKGAPTAAAADTSNTNTTLIIAAGSNGGANDTQCRIDFARSNSLYLTFGFDSDTSSVVAGHTKTTSDLALGFLGSKAVIITTAGASYWAAGMTVGAGGATLNGTTGNIIANGTGTQTIGGAGSDVLMQGKVVCGTATGATGSGVQIGGSTTSNMFWTASQGSGTTTMWIGNASINTTSDVRLKTNITPTSRDALGLLRQLPVRDFTWDDPSDTAEVNRNSRGRWTGFIAQEVIDIIPWTINAPDRTCATCRAGKACSEHKSFWHAEWEHLVPLTVRGIQQLSEMLVVQESRIAALEAVLSKLN